MKKLYLLFLLGTTVAQAQETAPLTVEKIMRDQKWLGTPPSNYRWSADSKTVYFDWNPENKEKDQLYQANVQGWKPVKADDKLAEPQMAVDYAYNKDRTLGLTEESGDLFLYEFKSKKKQRLTSTMDRESNAKFLANGNIAFQRGENVYTLDLKSNELKQLSNFVKGKKPARENGKRMPRIHG